MVNRFRLTIPGDERDIDPLNIEDIVLSYERLDKEGAFMFIKKLSKVEVSDSDYAWLLNVASIDKCRPIVLYYYCDGVEKYVGYFNYYNLDINYDNCVIGINATTNNPTLDKILNILDEELDLSDDDLLPHIPDYTVHVGNVYTYTHAKKINDIIDYICSQAGAITFVSKFLKDAVSPLPISLGELAVPYDTLFTNFINPYNQLMICRSLTSSSYEMRVTLGQLLSDLCLKYFNLRWYVDEVNSSLIVEHIKYFDALHYSNPAVVGIDLTLIDGGKWLDETNVFSIRKELIVSEEKWRPETPRHTDTGYLYGYGWRFWYDCAFPQNNIKFNRQDYETNPRAVEDLDVDCTLMLATYNGATTIETYNFDNVYAGDVVYNYPFVSGVGYYYWQWNAAYPVGRRDFNGSNFTMKSTQKIFKQIPVTVPLCCTEINPYDLVKTNIGNGNIDNYEVKVDTGMYTISLIYSDI